MRTLQYLVDKDVVIISGQMLHDRYWTSKQYIANELIKENRVLYVEANYSVGKLFLGLLGKGWPVTLFGRLTRDASGIDVLTPPPRLPWRNHFHWLGQLNQLILRRKINRAMRKLNYQRPIFWTFLHQTAALIGKIPAAYWIYHCVDDWPVRLSISGMGKKTQIIRDESALIQKSDVTFYVSKGLLTDYQLPLDKCLFIPNGVDLTLFNPEKLENKECPEDLKPFRGKIAGFSGSFGYWFDYKFLAAVARQNPTIQFVLIGLDSSGGKLHAIGKLPNVHYLGLKPQSAVPQYVKCFDVCLMVFDESRTSLGLYPQKFFQYLAMGKPVVSTNLPSLKPHEDLIYLAGNADEFSMKLVEALQEKPDKLRESRVRAAQAFSWPERIREYDNTLTQLITSKTE